MNSPLITRIGRMVADEIRKIGISAQSASSAANQKILREISFLGSGLSGLGGGRSDWIALNFIIIDVM